MQNPAIHRMRRDVVLAGYVELPRAIGYDLLMDVAIRTADVHVRARVVGHQAEVLAAPRPNNRARWLRRSHQIAGTEGRHRGDEGQRNSSHHGSNVSLATSLSL